MDPLERSPTASANSPCQACRYARATAHDGLYCDRCTGSPYPCEVERASSPLEAWLYHACGCHGRFFEPKATAPEWIAADAAGRGNHLPRSSF
jgi:hypothetical protein